MAHFYGTLHGQGETKKSVCGTRKTGIRSMIQGEKLGVEVYGEEMTTGDSFVIYATYGRDGERSDVRLGKVYLMSSGSLTFIPD